jgi:hypothetical protein
VTVAVSGGTGNPTPSGAVTLTGGGYTSTATTLTSGSATINIPSGSLATGSDTLSASYTPDSNSSSTYNSATGSNSVTVTTPAKTTPTVTVAPSASSITTAQALTVTVVVSGGTGNPIATGSVTLSGSSYTSTATTLSSGSATINIPAGSLATGSDILTGSYTPDSASSSTYNTAAGTSSTVTVTQVTPTITWATPAAITYGTVLSVTQLDATASVPGSFVYTPAAGSMPALGSDTLSVTFTPADTVDYNTAGATVTLKVNSPSNPVPVMGSMTPAIANAGGAAFTLTVNGLEFTPSSTVNWGTTPLATKFVSATQLTAQVTAADIATAGAYAITVQTPAPGGGTTGILQFEVDTAGSTATGPTFTLTTGSVTAGSSASYPVTLPSTVTTSTVSCLNLPPGASCSYSATTNTVTITTSAATPAGTYQVTVVFNETVSGAATSWILLPILLLPLVFLRRRMAARGVWVTACLGLVLLAGATPCTGCGGGGGGGGGSTGGGGGSGGGTQTHQVTSSGVVTLTVQ